MKPLSIQIHPDDEYALENENEFGKNEMWYVADCELGSYLYCGLFKDASKEEIRERIGNNTLTEILICEIQQNSNCTYRMYDYDRCDKFGNKRELHVDKALDVVDTASFHSMIFTEGCGTIRVGEDVKAYKAGDSFYITAGNKTVEIEGPGVAIVTKV